MPEIPAQILALASILGSVALALWQAYQWWSGRLDKREADRDAADDRQMALLSGQRDRITADLRTDLTACRADLEATARDRNRGWDLARRHHDTLWQFYRGWRDAVSVAREARQIANALARFIPPERAEELTPTWGIPLEGPPAMPPFDDAKP